MLFRSGVECLVERERAGAPVGGAQAAGGVIGEDVAPALPVDAAGEDAAGVGLGAGGGGRIDGDDDAGEIGRDVEALPFDLGAVPERVVAILDQLAVEFLAAEAGTGVAADHGVEEARRQIEGVGAGRGARHHGRGIGDQAFDQGDRTRRRGGDLAGPSAEAQTELQHVPHLLGMAPLGDLVGPGDLELGAAQGFRVVPHTAMLKKIDTSSVENGNGHWYDSAYADFSSYMQALLGSSTQKSLVSTISNQVVEVQDSAALKAAFLKIIKTQAISCAQ